MFVSRRVLFLRVGKKIVFKKHLKTRLFKWRVTWESYVGVALPSSLYHIIYQQGVSYFEEFERLFKTLSQLKFLSVHFWNLLSVSKMSLNCLIISYKFDPLLEFTIRTVFCSHLIFYWQFYLILPFSLLHACRKINLSIFYLIAKISIFS